VKLAGSLSLAVSLPTMLVGFARYSLDSTFAVLGRNGRFVVAMAVGSVVGSFIKRDSGFVMRCQPFRTMPRRPVGSRESITSEVRLVASSRFLPPHGANSGGNSGGKSECKRTVGSNPALSAIPWEMSSQL
jgi:hypothetical protein